MTIAYDEHETLVKRKICFDCIGDAYLAGRAETEGKLRKCHYCNEKQRCVELVWLADHVEKAFETHFGRTSEEPDSFEYAMLRAPLKIALTLALLYD